jgi:rubrerythrin
MGFKSESALKKAMEMELEGMKFYMQSAEKVESQLAKKIFEELGKEEESHIQMIKKLYDELKEDKPLKEWVTRVGARGQLDKVFNESLIEKAKASKDDLQALRFALQMEEKGVKYYEGLAVETINPFEKRFYHALSYEERGHYLKILDSIEYLSDPAGWYYVKERDMVDGG